MPNSTTLKNLKRRLKLSGASIYFMVYGASVLVALIKTLFIASSLVPEQMGWFISLSLVAALMIYFCNLGVMDAYLIRTRSVQRKEASAALLRGQLYIVTLVMSTITTALIMAYGYFYAQLHYQVAHPALVAAYLFLQPLLAASLIDLQADRRLIKYATYTLIKSLVPLIIIAVAISMQSSYIDINFILICEVFTTFTLIGIAVNSYRHNLIFKARRILVMQLVRQGIYFTGQMMINNLTSNLDKWFVLTIYGLAFVGAYSISNQMILVGSAIGGMCTTYMIPHIYISQNNRIEVIKCLNTWSTALAISGTLLSITVLYAFWGYITHYYSRYTLSFEIFICASVTMAFIGANFYEVYFRAIKSGKQYFYIQAVSNLLLITLLTFVYFLSLNVYWVAFSVMFVKVFTWATCHITLKLDSKSK